MPSLNSLHIMGHCGKDVELKYTPTGKAVATFSVAVSSNRKVGEEWKKETEWFNICAWGALAERLNQTLANGSLVFVAGKLKTRTWEGQDGQKKYRTEVIADQVLLLDKREKQEAGKQTNNVDDPEEIPF